MPFMPVLTEAMRKVLAQAQVESRHLNQEFVGTEHLLLALLHSEHNDVARVLRTQQVDVELLRTQISEFLPFSETPPAVSGDLPLSPKSTRLISSAVVKSRALREPKVSTRIFLLTLMDEGHPLFADALKTAGVDAARLQAQLAAKPQHPEE
jgi:ATP-dependent Clp protease ATP-binding subunit ClpC